MLAAALNASMRGRERAPVVLTCRIGEYQALTRGIDRATHIEMLPLTSDEAVGYLLDQFLNDNEHQRWEPVLADLHVSPRGPLATQLATPWRLTLALTAFREEGNPSSLLPSAHDLAGTSAQMYAQRVDSLLLGRYVSSAVRLHDPGRRYTKQDVQRWLTALADGLARQARQNKSATDIQLDRWWEPMGRWSTRAVHIAVAALPGLAWLGYGLALHSFYFCTAGGFLFLLAFAAGPAQSPSRLKVRQMAARRGLTRLAVGVGVGVGGGLTLGFALKSNGGFGYGIGSGLMLGIASGLALAMLDDSSPQAIAPRDVIKEDGRYGLMMGGGRARAGGPARARACARVQGRAPVRARHRARGRARIRARIRARDPGQRMDAVPRNSHDHRSPAARSTTVRHVPGLGTAGGAHARIRGRLPVQAPPAPRLAHSLRDTYVARLGGASSLTAGSNGRIPLRSSMNCCRSLPVLMPKGGRCAR